MWKKRKKLVFDKNNIPKHIAFICDGNRRWAKNKGLPKLLGHKEGTEAIKRVVRRIVELKVQNVTFFVFSTENFNREKKEIDYLFDLFYSMKNYVQDFIKDDYKFHHAGDKSLLPKSLVDVLDELEEKTKDCKTGTINFALSYGGRNDIVNATKKIIDLGVKKEDITEESFKKYLSTGDMPDVDILVRTSGEQRISGFLLYNMAYAELYFVKKHWPAFTEKDVDEAIREYQSRNRRFGK